MRQKAQTRERLRWRGIVKLYRTSDFVTSWRPHWTKNVAEVPVIGCDERSPDQLSLGVEGEKFDADTGYLSHHDHLVPGARNDQADSDDLSK